MKGGKSVGLDELLGVCFKLGGLFTYLLDSLCLERVVCSATMGWVSYFPYFQAMALAIITVVSFQ